MFKMAVFIAVVAGLLLLWTRPSPGTPEFVITVTTLVLGVGFAAVILISVKLSQRWKNRELSKLRKRAE
jgi:hypothetical protein